MEPEGSLPRSQVPAICPYSETVRSSPYPHNPLAEDPSLYYLPSTPGSPKWSLSLRFRHQNPVYTFPRSHTCYMPRSSHSYRFYHPNNIAVSYKRLLKVSCFITVSDTAFFNYLLAPAVFGTTTLQRSLLAPVVRIKVNAELFCLFKNYT